MIVLATVNIVIKQTLLILNILELNLPLTDPVLKFFLILLIILFSPILLNKIRIPHLLGLIIAGAIIGPNGLNLIERDNGIILSGTAGLLYIMFLAGLEIDLADFKKNGKKSLVFGLFTFIIPMVLGTFVGLYILEISIASSFLLASMFASHTLIAYPIISKLGIAKNRAVNITVGGTMITDTLALLVLAIIVGMAKGNVDTAFWLRLLFGIVIFGLIVIFIFPIIAKWFLKRFDDNISQYIFVLAMVFLGAVLAEIASIEPIIGAFLAGLSLNPLIPHSSPLMNRIGFVGNAIFIPFFLLGVGMLIDFNVFFTDSKTIIVALVMIITATLSKFLAAWLTQKTYNFSTDERRLIFGLSNAQAAATLAAVLVGYNTILSTTASGEPIRLFDETILNGTILMILVTCTIASFVAQKGAKNLVLSQNSHLDLGHEEENQEKILIPISNIENTEELITLAIAVKSKRNKDGFFAMNIVDNNSIDGTVDRLARKILDKAVVIASATDNNLRTILRYDLSIINGINSIVRENNITDLILGLHAKKRLSDSFLGDLTEGILSKCNTTTLIYKSTQPLAAIKRHVIFIPANAEKELGFAFWLIKVWNIAQNTGSRLKFYASKSTLEYIEEIHIKYPVECEFIEFNEWENLLNYNNEINKSDNLIFVLSRKEGPSYLKSMLNIPDYLNSNFRNNSFILIYPMQEGVSDTSKINLMNPSFIEPIEKLDIIGKNIAKVFKNR